ncbi:hypothetical protein CL634_03360 [bacterium]|nr:hypothetical protein [bacterium]
MKNLKTLYNFKVNKTIKEIEEIKEKNDKGEEVTTKKETSKVVQAHFSIKKPNRKLHEEGELNYAVKLSEGIRAGLLTRPLLAKRYKNDGGPMSDSEKEKYAELYYQMITKQEAVERLKLNLENEDEERRQVKVTELMTDIIGLRGDIQEYELAQSSLFDQTAEKRSQNNTIMWWVLHLAYEKLDDDYFPVFGDGDYESRVNKYDEIEEKDDPFWVEVVKKFAYFVTFWYLNGVTEEKDFEEVEDIYRKDNDLPSIKEEAEAKRKAKDEAEEKAEEKAEEEAKKKAAAEKKAKKKKEAKKEKEAKEVEESKPEVSEEKEPEQKKSEEEIAADAS